MMQGTQAESDDARARSKSRQGEVGCARWPKRRRRAREGRRARAHRSMSRVSTRAWKVAACSAVSPDGPAPPRPAQSACPPHPAAHAPRALRSHPPARRRRRAPRIDRMAQHARAQAGAGAPHPRWSAPRDRRRARAGAARLRASPLSSSPTLRAARVSGGLAPRRAPRRVSVRAQTMEAGRRSEGAAAAAAAAAASGGGGGGGSESLGGYTAGCRDGGGCWEGGVLGGRGVGREAVQSGLPCWCDAGGSASTTCCGRSAKCSPPPIAARCSGVRPPASRAATSAPASTSALITSGQPAPEAPLRLRPKRR
jgi:hypothetical protein